MDSTNPSLYRVIKDQAAEIIQLKLTNQRLQETNTSLRMQRDMGSSLNPSKHYWAGFRAALSLQARHHAGCKCAADQHEWADGYSAVGHMPTQEAINRVVQYARWKAGEYAEWRERCRWQKQHEREAGFHMRPPNKPRLSKRAKAAIARGETVKPRLITQS